MKNLLKEKRIECGLTQSEIANIIGVSRRTYISYEQGKINEDSFKYRYILDILNKKCLIDEEHGILSMDKIKDKVANILSPYSDVNYCYLFGSYAKGKANEKSDVDLLIGMPLSSAIYLEILESLREGLKKKVDLIHISELNNNQELLDEILKEGIKIYGKH